ncbi:MAG: nucleotidyl transferase AbiEii/AbiGii toxin family protein, partial [Dermatophilaceae bacterium]
MTYPTGLDSEEASFVAAQFGVALEQVRRDYLISLVLVAVQAHTDDVIFFGGTALARTFLTGGRLSEDIDLMAVTDRSATARA